MFKKISLRRAGGFLAYKYINICKSPNLGSRHPIRTVMPNTNIDIPHLMQAHSYHCNCLFLMSGTPGFRKLMYQKTGANFNGANTIPDLHNSNGRTETNRYFPESRYMTVPVSVYTINTSGNHKENAHSKFRL